MATTNSEGGTHGKWTPGLNPRCAGRKTISILEDNDETGRGHVIEVADNLRGIVPEIRIIDFRGELPEHGDVSDWLAQGHTKEELLEKAKAGRIPDYRFKLVPFNEISLNTTPAYLVKDLLPRIGLTVFWGPPKCGKSFFVFDLMMHVALGWKFRDLKVK
jgi:AAA domain